MSKTTTTKVDPEIVARRRSFDGVEINLHADGSLSTRMHFIGRTKLPTDIMFRISDDLALYTYDEIPTLIKSVNSGAWEKAQKRNAAAASSRAVPESERVYRGIDLANGATSYIRIK